MYFHFSYTDEVWFVLINSQALIWFLETTMTVLSYYLKNGLSLGRLVLVSYPERGVGVRLDWHQSPYLCSITMMSSQHQVMSKLYCKVTWRDL